MFGNKHFTKKPAPLTKMEVECCQCWKKISIVYVKPENEEDYKDIYHICPECFIELTKKGNHK